LTPDSRRERNDHGRRELDASRPARRQTISQRNRFRRYGVLGSLSVTLAPQQLEALNASAAAVTGHRFGNLGWVSAGRE
jgi:hypothetical protein